jgi:uncharacterized protein (DUF1778 family)
MASKTAAKKKDGRGLPAWVHVRLKESEHDKWQKAAEKDGRTVSSLVRFIVNQAVSASA